MTDGSGGYEPDSMTWGLPDDAVREAGDRLALLLGELSAEGQASNERVARALQELSTGLEELLAAQEELRAQSEELQRSHQAIDDERERYGQLFEFAPDAYLVTDEFGKIVEANNAASELLGVATRFLEGKLLATFVEDGDRRQFRRFLHGLSEPAGVVQEDFLRMRRRAGDGFAADVRALRRSGELPPVVRWTVHDLTRRIEMEDEIRALHTEVGVLASLGRVAHLTEDELSMEAVLDAVADLATTALPSCEVSLAVAGPTGPSRLELAGAWGERARRLGAAEMDNGDGPCFAAVRAGVEMHASLEECHLRWPAWGKAGAAAGLVSANCYPIVPPAGRAGALNIYAFADLSAQERSLLPLLAEQVVFALANVELYEGARSLALHLQRALETRGVIEQAKGALMARQGVSETEAFDILRRASQRTNRKLRDVSADLIAHLPTAAAHAGPGRTPRPATQQPDPASRPPST